MTAISDIVDSVYPSDGATGVILNDTIKITFDQEMDEHLLATAGFILEGPDSDQIINTDYGISTLSEGSEENALLSPGYQGIVPGAYTFVRLDLLTSNELHVEDTTGDGGLYRTQLQFKPTYPLKRDTDYTIYIVGDDAIKPRTVFDEVTDPSNTGTGLVTFSGTYTGISLSDTINIKITKAGVAGVAEYEWWKSSAPLDVEGPALTSRFMLNLLDGVSVQFLEGTFNVNDEYSVVVKKQDYFTGIVTATFKTGSGSIEAVPTVSATSILGDPVVTTSTSFKVSSITPADGSSNLSDKFYRTITVEFSDNIDADTVTQDSVKITAEPVIDHPNLTVESPNGEVAKTLTVSGKKLIISL